MVEFASRFGELAARETRVVILQDVQRSATRLRITINMSSKEPEAEEAIQYRTELRIGRWHGRCCDIGFCGTKFVSA